MWKFFIFAFYVLLLLALPPTVNSNETPTPTTLHRSSPTSSTASLVTGVCAVCQDYRCTTDTSAIWKGNDEDNLWKKEISNCSTDNLNSDVPCRMPNGWLVLLTDQQVLFERRIPSGARETFTSVNMPCADLNLPPSSTPSPVIQAPIHNTPTPAASNISVAGKKGIIGSVIGIIFIISITSIGVLIWKRNSRGQGQDRDHRHGKNGVPPHYAEDRDEITIKKQPLKEEILNGNFNGEDDSVGTAGLLGHCDDSPV